MKKLYIEKPHEEIEEYPFDESTKRWFNLDKDDIRELEKGNVV